MMKAFAWNCEFLLYCFFSRWFGRLVKLNLMVSSICNSHCQSCHIWKTPKESQNTDLSLEQYRLLFAHSPKTICWISLTGGEPFLREDLLEIVQLAYQYFPRLILLSITTNGLAARGPTRTIASILSKCPRIRLYVNLSVDDIGSHHDKIRGMKGNFSSLASLCSSLCEMRKDYPRRLRISLETTLLRENILSISKLQNLARQWGVHSFFTLGRGSPFYKRESGELYLRNDEVPRLLGQLLRSIPIKLSIEAFLSRAFYVGIKRYYETLKHPVRCVAGQNSLMVSAKGVVSPCIHWPIVLGNTIEGDSINVISKSATCRNTIEKIREEGCPGCWTPCEAMQSLVFSPFRAMGLTLAE